MNPPPFNLAAVEAATIQGIERGCRPVLQTHYYASEDRDHVAQLLQWLSPQEGAIVIDAGCGIGEVSRLMAQMRPDLAFLLINISPLQLSLSPEDGDQFHRLLADCHDLSAHVPDDFSQAIMYSSALCQMDAPVALAEAWRVLSEGGVLLINDMVRGAEDGGELEAALAARVLRLEALQDSVTAAGFSIDFVLLPEGIDTHFRELLQEAGQERLLEGVHPVVIRATKRITS